MTEFICSKCKNPIMRHQKVITGPFATRAELRLAVEKAFHKKLMTGLAIAKLYGISPATVSRLLHGDKKQIN